MHVLITKLKEVMSSVLPITIIVLILNFTLVPMDSMLVIRFLIASVLIIISLSVFLLGVDIGISNIGNIVGNTIAKSNKLLVVIIAGLIFGFIISAAEPDLHVLAGQVDSVTSGAISRFSIVAIVSIGIAIMMALGLVRIVHNIPLNKMLICIYFISLVLAIFTPREFLAISFDASGATTGALTVPFMLALDAGVSSMKKDSRASESDSFGLVGIASSGAVLSVIIMGIFSKNSTLTGSLEQSESISNSIISSFLHPLPKMLFDSAIALLPIVTIFFLIVYLFRSTYKVSRRVLRRIIVGILFTFIGLVIFFISINAGFMDVGSAIGFRIASMDNKAYLIIVGFALGFVTVLAEPAVHVLTHQIEDITTGYVKRKAVMFALSLGIGLAVALSMLRILVPGIQLWHYVLPILVFSLAMSIFVPKLFVGIAFDAGGVASGPMTATFILAFAQGAADAIEGASVMAEGFGMIAMVALTPLIALQVLGFIFKIKSKKEA